MRRLPLLAAVSVSFALCGPSAASAATCPGFVTSGLEITKLRATGLGCADARRVARLWVRSDDCNPTIGEPEECTPRRYRCVMTDGPGFNSTVVCRRAGRRVGFRVGPT